MVLILPKQNIMEDIDHLFYGDHPTRSMALISCICHSEPTRLHKLIQQMPSTSIPDTFSIVIDASATASLTHMKEDFQN